MFLMSQPDPVDRGTDGSDLYPWFPRDVIITMLENEDKRSLISAFVPPPAFERYIIVFYTAVLRKVVGKSARDNPVWVILSALFFKEI